jgi:GYF domain 2
MAAKASIVPDFRQDQDAALVPFGPTFVDLITDADRRETRIFSPSQACFSPQPTIVWMRLWELFMRDSWYYSVPEGQIGPITLQELKDTLPNLPNAKNVYIWHDSLPDWIRAGDLAEIVANAKMTSPQQARNNHGGGLDREFHDAAPTETAWDPQSLEGFHPDPTYAISAPASTPAAPAIAPIKGGRRYALVGILLGAVMVLLGCGLFYLGITGLVTWVANALGFTNQLVDASGIVLFVVGLVVIWSSRRKVAVE